jgi:NitT/TauT family transport system substrate-binding protein
MLRRTTFTSALLFSLLLLVPISYAETIVLSVPGPGSLVYMPVQLAKAIEADRAEGLELKLRFFSGGPLAIRDLSDNNSDFAVVGLPAIASSRADQMSVLAIGQLSQAAMVTLMLHSSLKNKVHNIAQLKGMRIGVNTSTRTARSTSQMLTEYVIQRAGLKISEVQIIPAGQNREAQRAALVSNTVDAVMGDEPFATELGNQGLATILVNLYNPQKSRELLGGPFVHAALATREEVYQQYPQTVRKVQRMFDRTLLWIATHSPAEVIVKLAKQPGFDGANKQALLSVLQKNPGMYPEHCAWDAQAVETTEKFVHEMATNQKEIQLHFADFVRNASADSP